MQPKRIQTRHNNFKNVREHPHLTHVDNKWRKVIGGDEKREMCDEAEWWKHERACHKCHVGGHLAKSYLQKESNSASMEVAKCKPD